MILILKFSKNLATILKITKVNRVTLTELRKLFQRTGHLITEGEVKSYKSKKQLYYIMDSLPKRFLGLRGRLLTQGEWGMAWRFVSSSLVALEFLALSDVRDSFFFGKLIVDCDWDRV